jgi:hypothetical protein
MMKRYLYYLSLLFVFLGVNTATASLEGLWTNSRGSFHFANDGSVLMKWANGSQLVGQWQLKGDTLNINTANGPMTFQAHHQGDTLVLIDNQGSYQLQRTPQQNAPHSTPRVTTPPTSNQPLSETEYIRFLENYPNMSAESIYANMAAMTQNQLLNFNIWEALGSDIYTRLCKGGYNNIIWQSSSGPIGCGQLIAWEQQAIAFGGSASEANIQRMQVINMMKCSTGQHDKATCQAYRSATQGYNEGTIELMKAINKNMEPTPCTEYYNEQNVYLGCW